MKKIIFNLAAVIVIGLSALPAKADTHPFGLGIMLGDPTGFSFKYILGRDTAIDGALGWSDSISYNMHADYLFLKPNLFKISTQNVGWYFGIGGRVRDRKPERFNKDDDGLQLGVRAPIGMNLIFRDPRIEVFGEIAATMNLTPGTGLNLDLGIGGRYYF